MENAAHTSIEPRNQPLSHAAIIERAGGGARVSYYIGECGTNVRAWKRLNSIPGHAWRRMVDAGFASYPELAIAAEKRAGKKRA